MNDVQLGQTPSAEAKKDAIHLAVAPVMAGEQLEPGKHVGLAPDGTAIRSANPIGIVDPFLTEVVRIGDRFWLCLYPRSVTSMRHEWSHPGFDAAAQPATPNSDVDAVEKAKAWITKWADSLPQGINYDYAMKSAGAWVDYKVESQSWDNEEVPEEFWTHFKTITGKTGSGSFFACCPN